jgi:hypothetical protein
MQRMNEYILDVRGLADWSKLSQNEYGAIKSAVGKGRILILSRVWQEFKQIFPDEAAAMTEDATPRHRVTQADRWAASALADSINATFGPYDDGCDWVVAGKAIGAQLIIVTAEPLRSRFYKHVDGCKAISVSELLDELE